MAGSMRQRRRDSWQLRVYRGVEGTGRPRWTTTTVHGGQRHVQQRLAELAAEVDDARLRCGSVAELFERWFAAASPNWAATTAAQTRSIIDCHLVPELGYVPVDKLTTADIDDFYRHLRRSGGRDGRPLRPGTVHRIHVVLHRALTQAVRWEWIWLNPASTASPPRVPPTEIHPPDPAQVAQLLAFVQQRSPALFVFLRLAVSTAFMAAEMLTAGVPIATVSQRLSRACVDDSQRLRPRRPRRRPPRRRDPGRHPSRGQDGSGLGPAGRSRPARGSEHDRASCHR